MLPCNYHGSVWAEFFIIIWRRTFSKAYESLRPLHAPEGFSNFWNISELYSNGINKKLDVIKFGTLTSYRYVVWYQETNQLTLAQIYLPSLSRIIARRIFSDSFP